VIIVAVLDAWFNPWQNDLIRRASDITKPPGHNPSHSPHIKHARWTFLLNIIWVILFIGILAGLIVLTMVMMMVSIQSLIKPLAECHLLFRV
jgi:hypothetical protein